MRKRTLRTPDWSAALAHAASGEPPRMLAAANAAYGALVRHLVRLGFDNPPPYRFRYAALKAAPAGYVPGTILGAYGQTLRYLAKATHGVKHVDSAKGIAAVEMIQKLWKIVVPCPETSNHLKPTPETHAVLTEAIGASASSDDMTLRYYLEAAVDQLKYLQERTGKKNNWSAAEEAARSKLISGALAAQVFFASEDRNALKHPEKAGGWGPVTPVDIACGIRSICALFGLVPLFLRLPNGGRQDLPSTNVGPPEATQRRAGRKTPGPTDWTFYAWTYSEIGEKRQRALSFRFEGVFDEVCEILRDEKMRLRHDDLLGLLEETDKRCNLPNRDLVQAALGAAKRQAELSHGWVPTVEEGETIWEHLCNFLDMLEEVVEGRGLESDEGWYGDLDAYEIEKTLHRMR